MVAAGANLEERDSKKAKKKGEGGRERKRSGLSSGQIWAKDKKGNRGRTCAAKVARRERGRLEQRDEQGGDCGVLY